MKMEASQEPSLASSSLVYALDDDPLFGADRETFWDLDLDGTWSSMAFLIVSYLRESGLFPFDKVTSNVDHERSRAPWPGAMRGNPGVFCLDDASSLCNCIARSGN